MSTQINLFDMASRPDSPSEPIPGAKYTPNYLTPAEEAELIREVDSRPWRPDLKRRVQHYGYRYDYTAKRVTRDMYLGYLPDFLSVLALRLWEQNHAKKVPDQVIVNEYLPGQGISSHIDCVPCFGEQIATISLNSHCEMEFSTPRRSGDTEVRKHILEPRSLLTLSGEARYAWTHGIRGRLSDNGRVRTRRVSLTFRTVTL